MKNEGHERMPRFVVLLHETPADYPRKTHFDLMLEHGGTLRTWALEKMPAVGETVMAERLPDHRLAYLDYEGEVAGDRGRVSRVEAGEYEVIDDAVEAFVIRVRGTALGGTLTLTPLTEAPHSWRVSMSGP
jgi:hypothetical protein